MCNLSEAIEEKGIEKGIKKGQEKGQEQLNTLYRWLLSQDRIDDLKRATDNNEKDFLKTLFDEMEAFNVNN